MKCVSLKVRMKETETTHNSRHTDPDQRVAADRVGAERGSTSGIAQAPRWKYVYADVCKKSSKIIYLAASTSEDIFVYLALYSFYMRIHDVAGD